MRRSWAALVCFLSACGVDPSQPDAAPDLTLDSGVDAGTPVDAGDPWDPVRALLQERGRPSDGGVVAMGLVVFDQTNTRRFEFMVNGFSADQRVSVASASKLISATTIFEVIRQGKLSLSSNTGAVLGWTGANAAITLEQLLSFTSGLSPEAVCTLDRTVTLAQCVASISQMPLLTTPGTRFNYGSTHLAVAARMVEVVMGKTWNEVFDDALRVPLGLPADVTYYATPRTMGGRQNPLGAGGLRASINEYSAVLEVIFHRGQARGLTIGTPALFDAQMREPFPTVTVGHSPAQQMGLPFRYGLCGWLECSTPATGCSTLDSAGTWGFTPWFDRATNYYAVLGMEQTEGGTGASFAIPLEQQLQPLIRAALGR